MADSPLDCSNNLIPAVSDALGKFICANVPLSEGSLSFDSPAEWEGTKQDSILLYLYNVEIDPYLRNMPAQIALKQGSPGHELSLTSVPAPLAVDLTYMVVAYGSSGYNEQKIATGLARVLDTCGRIPSKYLTPILDRTGNGSLAVVPESASIHELRDLWAAFSPKTYHLTRLYKVPAVRIPSQIAESVDMVTQINVGAGPTKGAL